jgi:ELWxxDGT repeat protein
MSYFFSFGRTVSGLTHPTLIAVLLALVASLGAGTAAGAAAAAQSPYLVQDANPGSASSTPEGLVYAPSAAAPGLLFSANDGQHGVELWRSDSQPATASLVKDINSGPEASYPSLLTQVEGKVYFRADDGQRGYELWMSDGTGPGTELVEDINKGGAHAYPNDLTAAGSTLFFRADDGAHGYELWASDGTTSGTRLVRDIQSGAQGSRPEGLVAASSDRFQGVIFWADDGVHGIEPWASDGTRAGTYLLKDIAPGLDDSGPGPMTAVRAAGFQGVLFAADDQGRTKTSAGEELWRSDGTPAGTTLVMDINPGAGGSQIGDPTTAGPAGAQVVFFGARDGAQGHGYELWRSDGTPAGTGLVRDIQPGPGDSNPCHLTAMAGPGLGGVLFCADDGAHGAELWHSDGTAGGTTLVKDINPGPDGSSLAGLSSVWTRVYFQADDGTAGYGPELWASNGRPGGTFLVADLNPGLDGSYPALMTGNDGPHPWRLFFRADDGAHGRELWAMELSAVQYLPVLAR